MLKLRSRRIPTEMGASSVEKYRSGCCSFPSYTVKSCLRNVVTGRLAASTTLTGTRTRSTSTRKGRCSPEAVLWAAEDSSTLSPGLMWTGSEDWANACEAMTSIATRNNKNKTRGPLSMRHLETLVLPSGLSSLPRPRKNQHLQNWQVLDS